MSVATLEKKQQVAAAPSRAVDKAALADELVARARALVPVIRERAQEAEAQGNVHPQTIRDLEDAGLFEMLVPRRFGGHGLGLAPFFETIRVIAQGDLATAWVTSFLLEHNWWACRLPMQAQEEIFAKRSNVKIASAQSPTAKAQRVPGGYRISGSYPYSSAILHSDYCIYPGMVQDQGPPMMFLVDIADVKILDDWKMAAMAATGSRTGVLDNVFIPEHRAIHMRDFFSTLDHGGVGHEEPLYRARLMESLMTSMSALVLGAAEATIELGRQRLSRSAPFGTPRLKREPSRMRFADAWQKVRSARLLYDEAVRHALMREQLGQPWPEEATGQVELDTLTVVHTCKDAVRLVIDGAGSSAFQLQDPLQRYLRDVNMIATHVLGTDFDVIAERGSRLLLGLGRSPIDPPMAP